MVAPATRRGCWGWGSSSSWVLDVVVATDSTECAETKESPAKAVDESIS